MPIMDNQIAVMKFNMAFARKLIEDVPEEKMAVQPMPGMNHAAWIIGHITMPRAGMKDLLKPDTNLPADWIEKFNMGSKVVADRAAYPNKAELLAALKETEDKLAAGLAKLTEEDLAKPT